MDRAIDTANKTRAVIRLPIGSRTRMVIAVTDLDGTVLGLHRMPDATFFSIDVAVAKARNMVYFSRPRASADLPGIPGGTARHESHHRLRRAALFPPGIDGSDRGPFFDLYVKDALNPCTQGSQPANPESERDRVFPRRVAACIGTECWSAGWASAATASSRTIT